jgi:hypothetical protein
VRKNSRMHTPSQLCLSQMESAKKFKLWSPCCPVTGSGTVLRRVPMWQTANKTSAPGSLWGFLGQKLCREMLLHCILEEEDASWALVGDFYRLHASVLCDPAERPYYIPASGLGCEHNYVPGIVSPSNCTNVRVVWGILQHNNSWCFHDLNTIVGNTVKAK